MCDCNENTDSISLVPKLAEPIEIQANTVESEELPTRLAILDAPIPFLAVDVPNEPIKVADEPLVEKDISNPTVESPKSPESMPSPLDAETQKDVADKAQKTAKLKKYIKWSAVVLVAVVIIVFIIKKIKK